MSVIIACVTCPLACACGVGVAGAVWVVMRPKVGLVMLAFFLLVFGGAAYLKWYAQKHKDGSTVGRSVAVVDAEASRGAEDREVAEAAEAQNGVVEPQQELDENDSNQQVTAEV